MALVPYEKKHQRVLSLLPAMLGRHKKMAISKPGRGFHQNLTIVVPDLGLSSLQNGEKINF